MLSRFAHRLGRLLPVIAAAFVLLLAPRVARATNIAGGNIINQTWTPAGNPYIVSGDITVPAGAFLTIQAGTIVQFASTDGQASGLDTSRVEVIVKGTLTVSGTAAMPAQFKAQNGSAANTWYGIEIDAAALSASITGAQIQHAVNGIYSNAPGSVLTTSSTTIDTCTNGAYILDGTPTLDGLSESNSSVGFYFANKGGGTLSNCVARGNSSDGIYVSASTGNIVLNVTNCSLHQNGSDGIEVYSGSGVYSSTANIKNTNSTQNATRGVYRNTGFGTVNVTTTYSNVWGNPTNYSGTSGGTGTFSANPLYVNNTNLRLTSNSPSRFAGDNSLDIGPLPYVSDATPGLYGTLWTNTTLSLGGSPYTVGGDLTVGTGATLTIDPGVTLSFASTDIMAAYNDTSRSELNVAGVLIANGTAAQPITLTGAGAGAGAWYGVTFLPAATGSSFTNIVINETVNGVWNQAVGANTYDRIDVSTTTNGFYITDGTPVLNNCSASNGSVGFYYTNKGGGTLSKCQSRGNTSDGIYVSASTGNIVLTVDGCSSHQNGSDGIEVYSGSGVYSSTATIKNSNFTQNATRGVYRNTGFGTVNVTTTYSNVWGNPTNYSGTSGGTGTFSANPLYVSNSNLRLTSNSPSRFAGDTGQDIGPLPYVNDATPGLYGTLWTNTTLSLGGSPYTVGGDLTVGTGATLTIDPGVTLSFASADIMAAYNDTSRSELNVAGGKLVANGTKAQPITFTGAGAGASAWYGVSFLANAAQSSLTNAIINETVNGISYQATSANTIAYIAISTTVYGVYATDGTPTFDSVTVSGASTGFYITGKASPSLVNAVAASGTSDGVYVSASTGNIVANLTNCTLHANGSDGIEVYSGSGVYSATANLVNCIVTQNATRGVYRNTGFGTVNVTTTYSDVWGNPTNYSGTSAGTGCISANPLYVAAPSNLKLQNGSVCVDAGTANGAPNHDAEGTLRPINGDGINAAEYDMGAYEMAPASFCGDGIQNAGEICDEGAQNGTYGHCKADCSGLGPRCGDGTVNGPEQCDDGNMVNTDACLNTCVNAACGDGVIRAGVEQCDDGNMVNTDACLNTCVNAACGDGVVRAGVEQCDDGNMVNTDACLNTCVNAACGDGVIRAGVEACDDGNQINTDACLNTCQAATCGDGVVQMGVEACDDGNPINTDACLNTCQTAKCGDSVVQAGVEQCDDGNMVNTDACLNTCQSAKCGDSVVQMGVEQCDDGNMNNSDACLNTCQSAKCGDGVVQAGVEQCDDGNLVNGDACLNSCLNATCGDGVVYSGAEDCDDGNQSNTDACVAACKAAKCGDGYVQANVEACDDGNQNDNDACRNDCKLPGCGDGVKQANEECDDGNLDQTDGCLNTCLLPSCGDGFVQKDVEQCDDGNADNTDDCTDLCEPAACGDGYVHDGAEECDDGNSSNTDDCVAGCKLATCGDGFVQAGAEQCDDGNQINDDLCPNSCLSATCGDGVKQANEACDDGNLSNLDDCLNSCNLPSCGDGFVHVGVEECDDGNGETGDGCDPTCHKETNTGGGGAGGGGAGGGGTGGVGGMTGGTGGAPGGSGGETGATGGEGGSKDAGGCGCRTTGGDSGSPMALLGLLATGLLVSRRRRGHGLSN
ncbi:MAG: DUF4215 domain-containing protein [Polyangiaceae bacterium]